LSQPWGRKSEETAVHVGHKACIIETHIRESKDSLHHSLPLLINQHLHFHLLKFNSSAPVLLAHCSHLSRNVGRCPGVKKSYRYISPRKKKKGFCRYML